MLFQHLLLLFTLFVKLNVYFIKVESIVVFQFINSFIDQDIRR